ncbi:MAG TPA: acyl carrier protein, partial [bacterium]
MKRPRGRDSLSHGNHSCTVAEQARIVATPTRELDRTAIESRVYEVTRELLEELGSAHAIAAIRGPAHLDRDLGLGSLERVELLARLDRDFHTTLPERVLAEADTLNDVVRAL